MLISSDIFHYNNTTIFVTVIGGMALYYLQFHKAEIVYAYDFVPPFKSQNENLSIVHININNQGNDIAEDVRSEIDVYPATIKDFSIKTDAPIDINTIKDSTKLVFTTKNLNELEGFKVSILTSSNDKYSGEPNIKIRAKGINGMKKEDTKEKDEKTPFSKLLLYISAFATGLTLLLRGLFKSKNVLEKQGKHSDDQNKIIAYLCGIHGLDEQADILLSLPNDVSYWSEVDRLTSKAINSDEEELINKIKRVLTDLLRYASIADSSVALIKYNLARIEIKNGQKDKANFLIVEAKKLSEELINTRIEIDPLFE